jgi:ring-1,2-phenylacetyl-CoA epoxidase subunit PaaC
MDMKFKYYLQIADNALILSHRLSEYCSNGPYLEEDLATTNVALDLLGLAEATLEEAGKMEGLGRSADDLAYRRPENQFYNTLLVEQPNVDFAHIIVRQFLSDAFDYCFFDELSKSKDPFLAALSVKSIKESTYHLRRSSEWMVRLGDGTDEANRKAQKALNTLWKFTGDMFLESDADKAMKESGIGVDLAAVRSQWIQKVKEILFMSKLNIASEEYYLYGGKEGRHSEYLGHILTEMQYLPSKYPDATW